MHKRSTRQLQLREQKLRELQLQEKLLDPSQHTRNTAASIALHAAIAATHAGCIAEHTAGWRRFLWNENYPPVPNKYFETYIRTKAADDILGYWYDDDDDDDTSAFVDKVVHACSQTKNEADDRYDESSIHYLRT